MLLIGYISGKRPLTNNLTVDLIMTGDQVRLSEGKAIQLIGCHSDTVYFTNIALFEQAQPEDVKSACLELSFSVVARNSGGITL